MTLTFQRAQREQIKIKIAVAGPAGSGKSEGALALARQLVGPTGRIAALDTENRALSLYADRYNFDVIDLAPPYETPFFADAIDAAVAGGYDALVIDSLSHQWEGEGGILDRKTKEERALGSRANGFALWQKYKAEHRVFMAKLVNAPIHVIACFRSREEHVQYEEGGKKKVEKIGMAPVTGEGAEYEFRIVFALTMEHVALSSKDNTGLFDGKFTNIRKDNSGGRLAAWLASAAPATVPNAPAVSTPVVPVSTSADGVDESRTSAAVSGTATTAASAELTLEQAKVLPLMGQAKNWGGHGGKPIGECPSSLLEGARSWFEQKSRDDASAGLPVKPARAAQIEAITLVLDERAAEQEELPLSEPPRSAPKSGQVNMPAPGRIEDALALGTPFEAPPPAAAEQPVAVGVGADGTPNSHGSLPEHDDFPFG